MSILFDEIGQHYAAATTGPPAALPALPLQYGDFARWQRQPSNAVTFDKQIAFWRAQLAGAEPVLELPTDRPRPAERSANGAVHRVVLPASLRDRLKVVSREANATLFMTLLAAFQTLLSRYTGREDIVVGSATAGRPDVDLEPMIGFFVNTVVLRTDLSGNPTFRELLGRVRAITLNAFEHQDVPFERLITDLQVPRRLDHSPLFQVMFILQNAPRQRFDLAAVAMEDLELDPGTAKFDLVLDAAEVEEGLSCAVEYSADIFDSATIVRMIGHFRCLLEAVAFDPDRRLSALPLLEAAERRQILVEWNDTAAHYPREQTLHQLFAAQAARTPNAVALIEGEQRMTYQELDARADQLAHHLRARGVEAGALVGVCIERSSAAVVGLLGVLKAGAAYVPLDPAYPSARLAFMLDDSRAPVLLTTSRLRERLPAGVAQVVELDAEAALLHREPVPHHAGTGSGHEVAYVMYTSGSTGTPKGVLGTHRGCLNRLAWMWSRWPYGADEVACQKTPLSFVDSVAEIFGPLLQGVPSVIVPDDVVTDPPRLVELLAAHRVTRIVLVPSLLRVILDSVPDLAARLPRLAFWITSGEAITPELARRFQASMPAATLVNLYGSSEVAADVSVYAVTGNEIGDSIPIGRPIANTRLYVLDAHANPVPIGVPGEIYVGGDGLALGYLRDPDLTARKFVPDPFTGGTSRLFRTGDLGRFRPDGNVEYLGRLDTQVKLRGVRIELSEIESVVGAHPAVRAAAAAVVGDGGDERLVGYVVPAGPAPEPDELRRFARQKLPDHMVPASFVVLGALPMTPSGKLDRRALPALAPARGAGTRQYAPPRNPAEESLARIVADVLQVDQVGIHDDFFELGGHSLLAVQVVARIRKTFRVELPMRRLFTEPTVAMLAAEIERARASGAAPAMPSPMRGLSNREELLARLAGLSDAEVEALLGSIAYRDQEPRTPKAP